MSTDNPMERIIPDAFFYSVFRNRLNTSLYVWWAGSHGMNIAPGEHFRILGDPRIPPSIPKAHGVVESIKMMIMDGAIEFCSSPAQVVDNNRPDGRSMALFAKDGDPYLDTVPLIKEELVTRTLPVITPVCTFEPATNEILIDWSAEADLEIHDTFTVTVTPPVGKELVIQCGPDKLTRYLVKNGAGAYKIMVTLATIDERTQTGVDVEVIVP